MTAARALAGAAVVASALQVIAQPWLRKPFFALTLLAPGLVDRLLRRLVH